MLTKILKTKIGVLWGRDCIFLDGKSSNENDQSLIIWGTINAGIVKELNPPVGFTENDEIPYRFKYTGVQGIKSHAIDDWLDNESNYPTFTDSSLEIVINSPWAMHDTELNHHLIATYDDVIEVLCCDYDFKFGDIK